MYSHSGAFVIKHCLGRKIFIDNNGFPISMLPLKILFTTTITTKYYSGNPLDRHSRKRTALLLTTFKTDLDGAIFFQVIQSTRHCTDLVLEKILPKKGTSNTSRNSSLKFNKINHVEQTRSRFQLTPERLAESGKNSSKTSKKKQK